MAAAEEAPDRAGEEAWLEGLLGMPEGHDAPVLPVRLARGPLRGGGAQASHHRGRRHHATHPRTPEEGLHLLSFHGFRRRVSLPGEFCSRWLSFQAGFISGVMKDEFSCCCCLSLWGVFSGGVYIRGYGERVLLLLMLGGFSFGVYFRKDEWGVIRCWRKMFCAMLCMSLIHYLKNVKHMHSHAAEFVYSQADVLYKKYCSCCYEG